ncbi:Heat shock protein beta-7 [Platysternon megacephalum]|uniref:Heat shock protein beta-7 n=1 Tax=Platysternon megacephalum TaxID=55544 RepID=A0A4D9EWR9_9SAUR|nr:Heat shock protein beta-7 [Platysternon megacephalum]
MSLKSSSAFRSERSFHHSSSPTPARDQHMEKARGLFGDDFGNFMRPRNEPLVFPARPGNMGNIKTLGDTYQFAVDVSDFSPEDIIVTTSNNQIEVHAEKVNGSTPEAFHVHRRTGPGAAARATPSAHNAPSALGRAVPFTEACRSHGHGGQDKTGVYSKPRAMCSSQIQ